MALTSKGSRPPFFFFIGPDMLLFKEEIDRLISSYPPSFGTWQKKVYWGDDSPTPKFWGEFTLSQLLGTSTYLVLRYANKWSASTWEKLDIVLKETSASCWPLIFLEVPNERGHPKIPSHISKAQSLKLAKKKGWVYANPGLTTNSILEYIKAQAAQFYPHIPPQILYNVSLEIPLDAQAVKNELGKLELFYADTKHAKDKDALLAKDRASDLNYFEIIKALQAGRLDSALKLIVAQKKEHDKHFFVLSAIIDNELRSLWLTKMGSPTGTPYQQKIRQTQANRLTFKDLAEAMSCVVEAEWRVKQGLASTSQSLDYLVVTLAKVWGPKRY